MKPDISQISSKFAEADTRLEEGDTDSVRQTVRASLD